MTDIDPKAVREGAKYPDTAWGRIRAYLDNATAVLSRVDLGELLAENVQLKRKLEWPDEQPQDERNARIAELERELRSLRGTELNPSPMVLDAQAYGELRDEIAATMGDGWDLDEAEISILIKYVRWLAAGQPRDEDGYPIRRETYRTVDAKAAQDGDARAVAALLDVLARTDQRNRPKVLHGPIAALRARFADRIAALDARDAKGGEPR